MKPENKRAVMRGCIFSSSMNNDNNGDNGNHEKKKTVKTIALSLKKRIAKTRIHIKNQGAAK